MAEIVEKVRAAAALVTVVSVFLVHLALMSFVWPQREEKKLAIVKCEAAVQRASFLKTVRDNSFLILCQCAVMSLNVS